MGGTATMKEKPYMQGKLRNMTAVYLLQNSKILLLYRQGSKVVNDMWIGAAGGHFEESELNDARACVLRELREELSVTEDMLENLHLKYIALRCVKGEIRQNYYFFANLKTDVEMELTSNEGVLQWFPLEELKNLEMPFSAKFAMEHYLEVGRYSDRLYGGMSDGEKIVFTEMSD